MSEWYSGPIDAHLKALNEATDELRDRLRQAWTELAPQSPKHETMSWIGNAVARAIDEQILEAVEPILLSERKPQPDDYGYDDIDGDCCWWGKQRDDHWSWKWGSWSGETHWLPASTKYLPARVEG